MTLLARFKRAARRLHEEQETGAAMAEFAIAFPLQFFVTLAMMQLALIFVGHVLTQQAAFAAARAAIVSDVPADGTVNGDANAVAADVENEAKRAACYVLMPICPRNAEFQAMTNNAVTSAPLDAISFVGNDSRSNAAYALTNKDVARIITTGPQENYVGAYLEFDMVLEIPVVNHWFAKLGGGNPGEFWFGPTTSGANTYNVASQHQKLTVLRLRHSAFLPKPWRAQ